MADMRVDDSKCLGCEHCGLACSGILEHGDNRQCWNIRMVNGVATIMNVELCRANQGKCHMVCLQNCPTKALSAQLKPLQKKKH